MSENLPWRCFHCDETFHTKEAAAEHFGDGNYEMEMPVCIEAATTEMKAAVITMREMWQRIQKLERDLENAEHARDCWAEAGRIATGNPTANWHDFAAAKRRLADERHALETMLAAAPWWLAQLLRARAEWRTQSPSRRIATLRRYCLVPSHKETPNDR
jgi:hypothetical protein